MISMKQWSVCLITALLAVIGLSGCSTYYYSTLSSADGVGDRTREGDFIQQNDTATVVYSFSGEDAPIHITIYNKLDEPLYVDWGRSAVIIDGQSTSYGGEMDFDPEEQVRFTSSHVEMIPPFSMVQRQPLTLANFPFKKIPDKEYRRMNYPTEDGERIRLQVRDYMPDDSPLYFRSYLTLFTGGTEGRLPRSLVFDRDFYISRLVKAGNLSPKDFKPMQQQSGDTFYVRYVKGRNFGYAVASIAVVVGVVALEVAVGPVDDYDY